MLPIHTRPNAHITMTSPCKTRSKSVQKSPTSVTTSLECWNEGRIQQVLCRRRDPVISIYFPVEVTPDKRNFVCRAFYFFSTLKESAPFNLEAFDDLLARDGIQSISFGTNFSAIRPLKQKYGGMKSLVRFFQYFQLRKAPLFEDDVNPKFFLAAEPHGEDDFLPVI